MPVRDPFQMLDQLDESVVEAIVARLEFRGRDPAFCAWRDAYLDRLDLANTSNLIEVGCGTGVVSRAIASRSDFHGKIVGSDPSRAMIDAARQLAAGEGLADRIAFRQDDPSLRDVPDSSFDRVVAHTVVSHAAEPEAIVREMARILAPDGMLAIFDGDYASWTFDHPDAELATVMEQAMISTIVANPRILRSMLRILDASGLRVLDRFGWIYLDIGPGGFFRNALDAFVPLLRKSTAAQQDQIETWAAYLYDAMARSVFFSACNYYAFVAAKDADSGI